MALVTGASRGLGHALACQLADGGYHIVAVGRHIASLEALDSCIRGQSTLVPMDLLDYPAIYRLAAAIKERFNRLDLLIGCAAHLPILTLLHHYAPLEWESTMGVNCTANWHLMRAFYPLLKENASPTGALFITDTTAPPTYWGAYRTSKIALEEVIHTWQYENQAPQVRIQLYAPPPMHTQLRRQAMPGGDETTWANPEDVARDILYSFPCL